MSAEQDLRSLQNNIRELADILEGGKFVDAVLVCRYLRVLVPYVEPPRPVCGACFKEIPLGETVYEIEGYVSTFFECESCFGSDDQS